MNTFLSSQQSNWVFHSKQLWASHPAGLGETYQWAPKAFSCQSCFSHLLVPNSCWPLSNLLVEPLWSCLPFLSPRLKWTVLLNWVLNLLWSNPLGFLQHSLPGSSIFFSESLLSWCPERSHLPAVASALLSRSDTGPWGSALRILSHLTPEHLPPSLSVIERIPFEYSNIKLYIFLARRKHRWIFISFLNTWKELSKPKSNGRNHKGNTGLRRKK